MPTKNPEPQYAENFAPEVVRPLTAWEERVRSMSDEEHDQHATKLGHEIKDHERALADLKMRANVLDAEISFREVGGGKENVEKWRARSILRAVDAVTRGGRR